MKIELFSQQTLQRVSRAFCLIHLNLISEGAKSLGIIWMRYQKTQFTCNKKRYCNEKNRAAHFANLCILNLLFFIVPASEQMKVQTNCGYKHNQTTHVVKTFIYKLDVSYAPKYIFRSNGYLIKLPLNLNTKTYQIWKGLKQFIRLAAGIVMIAILGKQNVDGMTGKRNTSKRYDQQPFFCHC